jgi:hypothetical protein
MEFGMAIRRRFRGHVCRLAQEVQAANDFGIDDDIAPIVHQLAATISSFITCNNASSGITPLSMILARTAAVILFGEPFFRPAWERLPPLRLIFIDCFSIRGSFTSASTCGQKRLNAKVYGFRL